MELDERERIVFYVSLGCVVSRSPQDDGETDAIHFFLLFSSLLLSFSAARCSFVVILNRTTQKARRKKKKTSSKQQGHFLGQIRWNHRQPSPHCCVEEINVSFFLRDDRMTKIFTAAFIESSTLTPQISDSIIQRADDYLQSLVDNRTFSGSVLLARKNQIILIKGYGCSEYVCHEKNTSQTIYRIGSVTKPFTAIIILRLDERKQLRLNDRLSLYCPDYPNGDKITIKHLLSNTSGIEDYTEMEVFENKCSQNLSQEELIEIFKNEPLKFKPGSKYSYSNSNVSEFRLLFLLYCETFLFSSFY